MVSRKKVLFISPKFFNYEVYIYNAIKAKGYDVDFFDERTSNNSFIKAIYRVKKDLLNTIVKKYYKAITEEIKDNKYDFFFLIKGEVVPQSFISDFKKNNPGAKLIYYTYDSISNNVNSVHILKHFDSCFSFDFSDVAAYPVLKLKHLFYTHDYVQQAQPPVKRKHTISFVGTLHSNRYPVIKSLFSNFSFNYVYFFSPAKWHFWLDKTFKKDYKNIRWEDVNFNKLTQYDVAKIFGESKSVLDIQRFGQSGLTMRTFEVLAAGSILVTTNSAIRNAEFYDPNYIVVVEDINDINTVNEINDKTAALKNSILEVNQSFSRYAVNNWVEEFFQ